MATLEQAQDFAAECDALAALLANARDEDFLTVTQFKGWTVNDVLLHLHLWNLLADLSLHDPGAFADTFAPVAKAFSEGTIRALERASAAERGRALVASWHRRALEMAARWEDADPKRRVPWAGPEMSARTLVTARQMETWAHGQEIFDLFGAKRPETDRIRNIVVLGVNTYAWSFAVRGMTPLGPMPRLSLLAPSGAIWAFEGSEGMISGSAIEFAQVVAQTRNIADTGLLVEGEVATAWMANAQCFAGPPETPPAPGTRGPAARPA